MSEENLQEEKEKEISVTPKKRGRPKKVELKTAVPDEEDLDSRADASEVTENPQGTETSEAIESSVTEEKSTETELSDEAPNDEAVTKSDEQSEPDDAPESEAESKEEPVTADTEENPSETEISADEPAKEVLTDVDYQSLSQEELIAHFETLLSNRPVQSLKNEVEEIKNEFQSKFNQEVAQKKEEFLTEGGNIIDFHHSSPLKKQFYALFSAYKDKRSAYYKDLKKDLEANLEKRRELVDELKSLLNAEENINTTYKHFKDIQDRWRNAGPIPRDKYNIVWNTYHHHVENFYDFLHLNREFRDLDFKHNLEKKLGLIARAEELANEENLSKAFRELQSLHKMWKEDIGPVAKEQREDVWAKFSAATKVIHDKRQEYLAEEEKHLEGNFDLKMKLVTDINELTANTKPSHQSWQQAIKKVQELRDQYFDAGKVPRRQAKQIWTLFKEATRAFNKEKNAFYKSQKKEQFSNLEQKRELIKIAEEHKDSEDFETVTPLMKKIQLDWKKIGHVPRKDSDKIWKQFKGACNHYFDRMHSKKNEASKEEEEHLESKQKLLEEITAFEPTGNKEADLDTIKDKIANWKSIGRVPFNKKNIEQKFGKTLDSVFAKMNLDAKEAEMIKFENKLSGFVSRDDDRKLQNEQFFISKKINETKDEIRQLENNLGFFQNADVDNPLVKEVHANIARHREQLEVWQAKLSKIKSIRNA